MSDMSDTRQTSPGVEVAVVWNPNTQTGQVSTITHIVKAPDTFCYGQIDDNGTVVAVYYSPFQHRWSR